VPEVYKSYKSHHDMLELTAETNIWFFTENTSVFRVMIYNFQAIELFMINIAKLNAFSVTLDTVRLSVHFTFEDSETGFNSE
jgi:hypothetical protein